MWIRTVDVTLVSPLDAFAWATSVRGYVAAARALTPAQASAMETAVTAVRPADVRIDTSCSSRTWGCPANLRPAGDAGVTAPRRLQLRPFGARSEMSCSERTGTGDWGLGIGDWGT